MNRYTLLKEIADYTTTDPQELEMVAETLHFVREQVQCFERELLIGHVTGSAWVLNPQKTHVLLMHHRKLDKWLQPGGHCDGDPDVLAVAKKETGEETSLITITETGKIFDIDAHVIPAKNGVPEHKHYDIRYILLAEMSDEILPSNTEAKSVRWVKLNDVSNYTADASIMRMVYKTVSANQKLLPPNL